jgi:hypothetical protein
MAQREQLDVARRVRMGAKHEEVQQQTNEGVADGEHHRVSVPVPSDPLA